MNVRRAEPKPSDIDLVAPLFRRRGAGCGTASGIIDTRQPRGQGTGAEWLGVRPRMSPKRRHQNLWFVWFAIAFGSLPVPSSAQYMYLDFNGDGKYTTREDRPARRTGEIGFDIWLRTDRNRDGSRSRAAESRSAPGLHSFGVLLHANWGTVRWVRFEPLLSGARVSKGPFSDSTDLYVEVSGQRYLGPGAHKIGRASFRVSDGNPGILIVPCSVRERSWSTYFVAKEGGSRLHLGPRLQWNPTPRVIPGDWSDADGSGSVPPEPANAGPIRVDRGVLYLGWNLIRLPYDLEYVEGQLTVNGLQLPDRSPGRYPIDATTDSKRRSSLDRFQLQITRALQRAGHADGLVMEAAADVYRLDPMVDSVSVNPREVRVLYRGEDTPVPIPILRPTPGAPAFPPHPDVGAGKELEQLAELLRRGAVVSIQGPGHRIIPNDRLARAIMRLQGGRALTAEDSIALRDHFPRGWDDVVHPVALRSVPR